MSEDRRPRLRRIGWDFRNAAGKTITPTAFIHPCWKDGCAADAPFGIGAALLKGQPGTWSCLEHLNELETRLRDNAPSKTDGEHYARSDGDRDLLDQ